MSQLHRNSTEIYDKPKECNNKRRCKSINYELSSAKKEKTKDMQRKYRIKEILKKETTAFQ